jgi:hypothetical protein
MCAAGRYIEKRPTGFPALPRRPPDGVYSGVADLAPGGLHIGQLEERQRHGELPAADLWKFFSIAYRERRKQILNAVSHVTEAMRHDVTSAILDV